MSILNTDKKDYMKTTAQTKVSLKSSQGFTLIELLVVIGILAILLAITLIAINPARQFSQSNDTKRRSDVNAILNAIDQYAADNNGTLPAGITTASLPISGPASATVADICSSLVTRYLAALPQDPLSNNGAPIIDCAAAYTTGYTVIKSAADNRVTVTATGEITPIITVTR